MIKNYIRNLGLPIIIFLLNYIIMCVFLFAMDFTACPFRITQILTAVLLAIIDYILMLYLYKNNNVIWKFIGVVIILIINYYSVIAADRLIVSDDAFAILEGSTMTLNSQVLVLMAIAIEFVYKIIIYIKRSRHS